MTVEVFMLEETKLNEKTLTENVSAHGVRVLLQQKLEPGQRVVINSPNEGVRSLARIVYCQRMSGRSFAVGLELSGRVEPWAKPY